MTLDSRPIDRRTQLEALLWRPDLKDPRGVWQYAYMCPAPVLDWMDGPPNNGKVFLGAWVYFVPRSAQAAIRSTVRRMSLKDWVSSDREPKSVQGKID